MRGDTPAKNNVSGAANNTLTFNLVDENISSNEDNSPVGYPENSQPNQVDSGVTPAMNRGMDACNSPSTTVFPDVPPFPVLTATDNDINPSTGEERRKLGLPSSTSKNLPTPVAFDDYCTFENP